MDLDLLNDSDPTSAAIAAPGSESSEASSGTRGSASGSRGAADGAEGSVGVDLDAAMLPRGCRGLGFRIGF